MKNGWLKTLTMCLLFSPLAQAEVLMDRCWDGTFAYQYLSVEKTDSALKVSLESGFPLGLSLELPESPDGWWGPMVISFELPLSEDSTRVRCTFVAQDPRILSCSGHRADVKIIQKYTGLVIQELKDFDVNFWVNKVLSASWTGTLLESLEGRISITKFGDSRSLDVSTHIPVNAEGKCGLQR